ncbi:MAG: hypothetical protein WC787_01300 [Patescibacteria group bacterium]|jgi:hypothetical protein
MKLGGLRAMGERVLTTVASRRGQATLLSVFLVIGILGVTRAASADALDDLSNWIFGQIGTLLAIVIDFLGKLVILLVNILIELASYNNFVKAAPVVIGWVLVRDVVNMFFIVILLVSAFSTIIGYGELKYDKVLPKLLLMAVLINFSKTLIGLMIDFSQVIMLTFVNAFKPAAGGNFINLLKLNKVTQLNKELTDLDAGSLTNLLVASMLAIMMLGIVLTILVIMIAFILYRIIGLWMILIMSPMAFFALALPGKLSKAMSAFTDDFWKNLSSMLIGGPVMAFFLWLALAIAQGGSGFDDLYNKTDSTEVSSINEFISEVGNAKDIATFMVAVAFLLAGVQFAVKTSAGLSSSLGSFAKGVSSGGGIAVQGARLAARLTGKSARIAGRTAGAAGSAGFNAIDRGVNIRGLAGRAGLAASSRLGGAGQETFAALAGYQGAQAGAKRKAQYAAQTKVAESLDPAGADAYFRRMSKGSGAAADAAKLRLAESATNGIGLKARTRNMKAEIAKDNPELAKDGVRLAAYAEAMALDRAAQDVKGGMELAERIGDDGKYEKYKEAMEKNPSLRKDWKEFGSIMGASVEDPKKYLEKIPTNAMRDGRTAIAHARALGLVDDQGNRIQNEGNAKTWEMVQKGDRGKYFMANLDAMKPEQIAVQLAAMGGNKDSIAAADAARYFVSKDEAGKVGGVFVANVKQDFKSAVTNNARNEAAIAEGRQRLASFRDDSPEADAARVAMAGAGASLVEAFKFNQAGVFENEANRNSFSQAMQGAAKGLREDNDESLKWIANLDTASLAKNPNGLNEARQKAAIAVTNDALINGYVRAESQGNTAAQKKLRELVDLIDAEGKRLEKQFASLQISKEEYAGVATNPTSPESRAVIQRMRSGGIDNPVDAATTATRAWDLRNDQKAYGLRNNVATRAASSVGGTARSAGGAVSGAASRAAGTVREMRSRTPEQKMEKDLDKKASKQARKGDVPPDIEPPRGGGNA